MVVDVGAVIGAGSLVDDDPPNGLSISPKCTAAIPTSATSPQEPSASLSTNKDRRTNRVPFNEHNKAPTEAGAVVSLACCGRRYFHPADFPPRRRVQIGTARNAYAHFRTSESRG